MTQGDLFAAAASAPATQLEPTGHAPAAWWPASREGYDVAACTRCSGVLYRAAGDPKAALEVLDAYARTLRPAGPCSPRPAWIGGLFRAE